MKIVKCIREAKGIKPILVGDEYYVIEENEEKYCFDFENGFIGWFPKSYFETISNSQPHSPTEQS